MNNQEKNRLIGKAVAEKTRMKYEPHNVEKIDGPITGTYWGKCSCGASGVYAPVKSHASKQTINYTSDLNAVTDAARVICDDYILMMNFNSALLEAIDYEGDSVAEHNFLSHTPSAEQVVDALIEVINE